MRSDITCERRFQNRPYFLPQYIIHPSYVPRHFYQGQKVDQKWHPRKFSMVLRCVPRRHVECTAAIGTQLLKPGLCALARKFLKRPWNPASFVLLIHFPLTRRYWLTVNLGCLSLYWSLYRLTTITATADFFFFFFFFFPPASLGSKKILIGRISATRLTSIHYQSLLGAGLIRIVLRNSREVKVPRTKTKAIRKKKKKTPHPVYLGSANHQARISLMKNAARLFTVMFRDQHQTCHGK